MNNRRNINTTQSSVQQMFRTEQPGLRTGYVGLEGEAKGASGDADAPFVKVPPFTDDPQQLVDGLVLPNAGDLGAEYLILPAVQCRLFRFIQIYLEYTMAAGGQLSLIPEVEALGAWYATTLVDSTVAAIVPTGTRFASGGFGSRNFEGTELRTDVLANGVARFALNFDVTGVEQFRLNVLDLSANPNNTLRVLYALST